MQSAQPLPRHVLLDEDDGELESVELASPPRRPLAKDADADGVVAAQPPRGQVPKPENVSDEYPQRLAPESFVAEVRCVGFGVCSVVLVCSQCVCCLISQPPSAEHSTNSQQPLLPGETDQAQTQTAAGLQSITSNGQTNTNAAILSVSDLPTTLASASVRVQPQQQQRQAPDITIEREGQPTITLTGNTIAALPLSSQPAPQNTTTTTNGAITGFAASAPSGQAPAPATPTRAAPQQQRTITSGFERMLRSLARATGGLVCSRSVSFYLVISVHLFTRTGLRACSAVVSASIHSRRRPGRLHNIQQNTTSKG